MQHLHQRRRSRTPAHVHALEVCRPGVGAAKDHPRTCSGTRQDSVPLLRQRLGIIAAHPVHVVEQDEPGDALLGPAQKLGDRGGMRAHALHQACLQCQEVVFLQVLGAAGTGVGAAQVQRPEVVRPERQAARHVLDGLANEARHAERVLALDFLALRVRHAQHAHGELARQGPVHPLAPHERLDAAGVDGALLVERARLQHRLDPIAQLGPHAQVRTEPARHHSGQAEVVERVPRIGLAEPVAVAVPVALRELRQSGAQNVAVQLLESRMAAQTEEQEEIFEVQRADAGELELQQRGLARIGIHRMHHRRALQRVVEGVAPRAGDDQDAVPWGKLQGLPVYRRILPAGVVDQGAGVDRVEHLLVEVIDELPGSVLQGKSSSTGGPRAPMGEIKVLA